jgi:hypothetical protein
VNPRSFVAFAATMLLVFGGGWHSVAESGAGATRAADADRGRTRPAPPDADLLTIRDIFRYGDEPRIESRAPRRDEVPEAAAVEHPPPTSRLHIIGLVHRADSRVAALAIDGEVLLLGEGESGAGFTVLAIRGETVRLRDPDGEETTLELP